MKKQLLLAVLLSSTGIFAQQQSQFKASNISTAKHQTANKSSVLVNQEAATTPIVSYIDELKNASIFTADDVIFTDAVTLQTFTVSGSLEEDANFATAYKGGHFIIFEDDNGKPASSPANAQTAKLNFDFDENNSAVTYNLQSLSVSFTIDLTKINNNSGIDLDANKTYWIAFAPKIDTDVLTSVWFKHGSTGDANLGGVIIDENNSMEAGLTNWTNLSDLGLSPSDLNMQIEGIVAGTLGTTEAYSSKSTFYPNPSSSKITFVEADKISKVQIYNLAGALVLETSQKDIDVSQLAKAVYIVKQVLKNGNTISSKFIKN